MAADPIAPPERLDPPEALLTRQATVGTGVVNTLRIPGDSFSDKTQTWFSRAAGMLRPTAGNEVKYLIDANAGFPDMVAAIRTATGPAAARHFIYLLNWWIDDAFLFPASPAPTALLPLLTAAAQNGVLIRGMFWDQQFSLQNNKEADHINKLGNGAAAIVDARGNEEQPIEQLIPFHFGSQHQKVLCVMGEAGLITFCGGLDWNPDRVQATGGGTPLHDVHCRIRGPAAADVLQVFIQRWNDHPEGQQFNRTRGPLITLNSLPASAGPQTVQIGRTFGRDPHYGFAPMGETTAREVIRTAILGARRYIYTEDQYFVGNPEVQQALITALTTNKIRHLTILLTHWRISDLPLIQSHRRTFIGALKAAGGDRVRVFYLAPPGSTVADLDAGNVPHSYVHSKIWIIDDEFAVIGTVNTNRRSWSHDSEVDAGIYDTSNDHILTYRFAHWLRIRLWQEHLNMKTPESAAELADGVASAAHWLKRPQGARVFPYDHTEQGDKHIPVPILGPLLELVAYNTIIDPA